MVVSQGRGAPGSAHKWGAHGLEVGRAVEFTFLSGPALHCPGCTRLGESSPLLYPPLSPPSDLSVGTRTPSIWLSCPPPAVTSQSLSLLPLGGHQSPASCVCSASSFLPPSQCPCPDSPFLPPHFKSSFSWTSKQSFPRSQHGLLCLLPAVLRPFSLLGTPLRPCWGPSAAPFHSHLPFDFRSAPVFP